jgi:hypothetical protein
MFVQNKKNLTAASYIPPDFGKWLGLMGLGQITYAGMQQWPLQHTVMPTVLSFYHTVSTASP